MEIKQEMVRFYRNIFEERRGDRPKFISNRVNRLSSREALELEVPFTEQEVWDVVKECGSSKAPGPDGVNFNFIKRFWMIIKDDLLLAI